MRTDSTVPACWKSSRRSSSVAWKERLPTNSFAGITGLLPRSGPKVHSLRVTGGAWGCLPVERVRNHEPTLKARFACAYRTDAPRPCQGQVRIIERGMFFVSRPLTRVGSAQTAAIGRLLG